jgi:hypothetical protein
VPEFTRRKVISDKKEAELEQEEGSECAEPARDAVLFLFGQQNMSLFLLLEEALGQDPQLIHCLVSTLEPQHDCSIYFYLTTTSTHFQVFQEGRCGQKTFLSSTSRPNSNDQFHAIYNIYQQVQVQ